MEGLKQGDHAVVVFLNIDVVHSSLLPGSRAERFQLFENFSNYVKKKISDYNGREVNWAKEGGIFFFYRSNIHEGNMYTDAVLSAIDILECLNIFNIKNHYIEEDIKVRITIHTGEIIYHHNHNQMESEELSLLAKNEREIGVSNTVVITEKVFNQLSERDKTKHVFHDTNRQFNSIKLYAYPRFESATLSAQYADVLQLIQDSQSRAFFFDSVEYKYHIYQNGDGYCSEKRRMVATSPPIYMDEICIGVTPSTSVCTDFEKLKFKAVTSDGRSIKHVPLEEGERRKNVLLIFLPPIIDDVPFEYTITWHWPNLWGNLISNLTDRGRMIFRTKIKNTIMELSLDTRLRLRFKDCSVSPSPTVECRVDQNGSRIIWQMGDIESGTVGSYVINCTRID